MSKRDLAVALLLGALVGGCADRPAPTEVADPAFSFVNNLDNGNPRVFRMEGTWGYLLTDPANDMFAIMHSRNNLRGCNGSAVLYSFMEEQAIFHDPDDPAAAMIGDLVRGRDIYMAVFEGYEAWNDGGRTCADLYAAMLAEGTGNLTNTDNDYYSYLRANRNANTYGYTANGTLELVGGGRASFHGRSHCVWDGNDPATEKCNNRIALH